MLRELEREFQSNPLWSRRKIRAIARRLGLKQRKVYKWNWDRKVVKNKETIERAYAGLPVDKIFKVVRMANYDCGKAAIFKAEKADAN
mmetsp:Transcript_33780/g.24828  ORF Transcript_33780/g.24828 Transcript_33780/m.24828 type:complete len:88 (+) Transcript_33780:652-915(+)